MLQLNLCNDQLHYFERLWATFFGVLSSTDFAQGQTSLVHPRLDAGCCARGSETIASCLLRCCVFCCVGMPAMLLEMSLLLACCSCPSCVVLQPSRVCIGVYTVFKLATPQGRASEMVGWQAALLMAMLRLLILAAAGTEANSVAHHHQSQFNSDTAATQHTAGSAQGEKSALSCIHLRHPCARKVHEVALSAQQRGRYRAATGELAAGNVKPIPRSC